MAPSKAFSRFLAAGRAPQTSRCLALRRRYHSYDHPPPPGAFNSAEQAILSAAYAHVPEHGFTQHALSLGARDAGYLDISTNILPDGPFSLIKYHLVTKREALAPRSVEIFNTTASASPGATSGSPQAQTLQVADKVERLTWERLVSNQKVIHRWQEVRSLLYLPRNPFHPVLSLPFPVARISTKQSLGARQTNANPTAFRGDLLRADM